MTEYDYSQDAVERYYAKLNSVAKWVDRQAQEAPGYGNPFLPSEDADGGAGSAYVPPTKNLSRSISTPVDPRAVDSRQSRPQRHHHHRGYSSNATLVQTYGTSAPKYSAGGSSQTQSQPQSRPHSQSRMQHTHLRPPPARSQTYAYASQTNLGASQSQVHGTSYPTRSTTQQQYTSAPGQPVVMQHGRQMYVVVPPHGGRVEVRSPQNVSPTYQSPVAPIPVYSQPISPTSSSKKQPLLKRLFSGSNSNTRRSDVPVMSGSARRRTTSMHY